MDSVQIYECDIAVIGGGLGGVAAALAACEAGASIVLTEETEWIGGQVTSQLVSALDEHKYIETFGGTQSYYRFRQLVRAHYEKLFTRQAPPTHDRPLNPGGGWVSGLCFEPRVGLQVLGEMLAPHVASGRLQILLNCRPVNARIVNGRLLEVACACKGQSGAAIRADYFLDATELGDLLPLAGVPFAVGAEAREDTGELHASADGPHPSQVQAFTCCFILEHCPGQDHTIPRPPGYEYWRDSQPFGLDAPAEAGGKPIHYPVFSPDYPGQRTFWTYRRIFDASRLAPGTKKYSLALINWDSNDYRGGNMIGASPQERTRLLQEAKSLSRAFLFWLQTEVQRDDGSRHGYPGLRLVPAAAGTADGFAKAPYIREARRLLGLRRVLEQDIVQQADMKAARARPFADSVGIGWYPIDVHACCNGPMPDYRFDQTLPYQIPLGALASPALPNLLAAAKNLSVTHLTNGAYRLHPVEWNTGEAAGALAAFCRNAGCTPAAIYADPGLLRRFQRRLLERGVPLAWALDVPSSCPDFSLLQQCLVRAPSSTGTPRHARLELRPLEPLTFGEAAALLASLPSARSEAVLVILADWNARPADRLEGSAFRQALDLLSLPDLFTGDAPSYLDLARILEPAIQEIAETAP